MTFSSVYVSTIVITRALQAKQVIGRLFIQNHIPQKLTLTKESVILRPGKAEKWSKLLLVQRTPAFRPEGSAVRTRQLPHRYKALLQLARLFYLCTLQRTPASPSLGILPAPGIKFDSVNILATIKILIYPPNNKL